MMKNAHLLLAMTLLASMTAYGQQGPEAAQTVPASDAGPGKSSQEIPGPPAKSTETGTTRTSSDIPVILEDRIDLPNGKSIPYSKHRVLHEKALDAYRKREPIYYKENAIVVETWKKVVVVKFMSFFEGSRSEIRVYDYSGELLQPAISFRGEVLINEAGQRILLGQYARHYRLEKSFLLDANGKQVAELAHAPYAFSFGSSDDGKIYWILSALVRSGTPRTQITVFDDQGAHLHTWETDKPQPVGFKYKEKSYQFDVPAPRAPNT